MTSFLSPSVSSDFFGYVLTFLLGVYDGFFSGGYVTLLTVLFVSLFSLSFVKAIATTKVYERVFFGNRHRRVYVARLIDYGLGMILGATSL